MSGITSDLTDTNWSSLMKDSCWYDFHASAELNGFLYRPFHLGPEPLTMTFFLKGQTYVVLNNCLHIQSKHIT